MFKLLKGTHCVLSLQSMMKQPGVKWPGSLALVHSYITHKAGMLHKETPTVKLVYKDHPRDQRNVVLIHIGSLYTGSITCINYTPGAL